MQLCNLFLGIKQMESATLVSSKAVTNRKTSSTSEKYSKNKKKPLKLNIKTFETRVIFGEEDPAILSEMAGIYSHIMHKLFAATQSGEDSSKLKSSYLEDYEITGRQFNAIESQLKGKIASIEARLPELIKDKEEKISRLEKKMPYYEKNGGERAHRKKRKLTSLREQLADLKKDLQEGRIRLCFGSKKLWRAQFNLKENGYSCHKEWLQDWKESRAREIFFLGSHEEIQGNQSCSAFIQEDGSISLRIRLTNGLAKKHGKYFWIHGVHFVYGNKEIQNALEAHKQKKGQALSFRLLKDEKGWRVFISLDVQAPEIISRNDIGVIGLDINVDHLALVELDRFGNPLQGKIIPFQVKNKTSNQAKAILGDACAEAVAFAEGLKKPIVLEKLNFAKKKARLKDLGASMARMLSSFAYSAILELCKSRALKKGIKTLEVEPAYTSVIGRVCYAKRYGMSVHESAALVIGRRFMGLSERCPSGHRNIPDGKGGHVTVLLSARNASMHVWSTWSDVSKKVQAALKARFQAAKSRSSGPRK